MVRPGTAVATVPQQPQHHTIVAPSGARPAVPRPQPHSKFVCGVKGTHRELRSVEQEYGLSLTQLLYIINNYV